MNVVMNAPTLMLLAWLVEACVGWPDWLYRRIGHPVVWIGLLISAFDRALNKDAWSHAVRYGAGVATTLLVVASMVTFATIATNLLPATWWGTIVEIFLASSLIASRSLYTHVADVARPLAVGDIDGARHAVSMIVGRDPEQLDDAGIARASLESLAENASDGVVAPLFWGALFGLPGLAAYKVINTLDSMIGHKNDRYGAFGGFAARLDDAVNIIPARITGLLIAVVTLKSHAFKAMFRDARSHRSPNAGWPEAAMAGALGVRLSGPRAYGSEFKEEAWLNRDARDPKVNDLQEGLALYIRAMALGAGLLGVVAWGAGQ